MVSEVEAAVRRFFEEVWNQGNVVAAPDFLAAGFVSHNTVDVAVLGPDEYGRSVLGYRAAFPDLITHAGGCLRDGGQGRGPPIDRATHRGEFMGRPGTGRAVVSTWIEIFRLESGKASRYGWRRTCAGCSTRSPDKFVRSI